MTIKAVNEAGARSPRLKLGMVGGGRGAFIGAVHRIAARLDDQYEVVAGALSADPERARASAADIGIAPERAYADFRTMARAEAERPDGIDVVAIVTPNHLHHPIARAFLDAGIHVICDKPISRTVEEAEDLVRAVAKSGKVFVLTHNYTGYPMVRHAREMIAAGELGPIRIVQAEYPQEWLTTPLERSGQKQAEWRTDPERSGAGGCLGDIGTHAFNLAEFVSGLRIECVAAELTTFVDGRRLDDNVQMMLRFAGGARGALWSSQVAPGHENGLQLRLYGEKGGLIWHQERPDHLHFTPYGKSPQLVTRGGPAAASAAAHATRIPAGHPEGFLEGFAQLYADAAALIRARESGRTPDASAALLPTAEDGLRAMRFIAATVSSSRDDSAWTPLPWPADKEEGRVGNGSIVLRDGGAAALPSQGSGPISSQ
jgi:predicted dehydrogenase